MEHSSVACSQLFKCFDVAALVEGATNTSAAEVSLRGRGRGYGGRATIHNADAPGPPPPETPEHQSCWRLLAESFVNDAIRIAGTLAGTKQSR